MTWTPPFPATGSTPIVSRYTVAQGDSAYTIATKLYGSPEPYWRILLDANGIDDPRSLYPGQVLVVA